MYALPNREAEAGERIDRSCAPSWKCGRLAKLCNLVIRDSAHAHSPRHTEKQAHEQTKGRCFSFLFTLLGCSWAGGGEGAIWPRLFDLETVRRRDTEIRTVYAAGHMGGGGSSFLVADTIFEPLLASVLILQVSLL